MTNITIRMEDPDKIAFADIYKQLGLSVFSMFNIFAKKVIRENGVPFSMNIDSFYRKESMEVLKKSINQLNEENVQNHELIRD